MAHIFAQFILFCFYQIQIIFLNFSFRCDDFIKIHIYRNVRECYTFALESNLNNELANTKLSECNALIKPESSTIIKVVAVMAVVACILFLI